MKNSILLFTLLAFVTGCQPKAAEPASVGKIWKALSVKQNGTIVYAEGATTNTKPGYQMFRLDLTAPDQVYFTDLDGRKTEGIWSLSTDNKRLILENLTPPPSESTGNIEFYIVATPTDKELSLKRTNESRKTGNSVNEYVLVPE